MYKFTLWWDFVVVVSSECGVGSILVILLLLQNLKHVLRNERGSSFAFASTCRSFIFSHSTALHTSRSSNPIGSVCQALSRESAPLLQQRSFRTEHHETNKSSGTHTHTQSIYAAVVPMEAFLAIYEQSKSNGVPA